MAKFKSIPGASIKGILPKFGPDGILEINDPEAIKILSSAKYVERLDEVKAPKAFEPIAPVEAKSAAVEEIKKSVAKPKAAKGGKNG